MTPATAPLAADPAIAPEDADRAGFYGVLSNLLATPPSGALLDALATAGPLAVDPGVPEGLALAAAWDGLRAAAGESDTAAVHAEWNALFCGTGRPPVLPYASYYETGFLMEKPLARVRDDLAALGLAREGDCGEPEDHLAALCDAMRALIGDGVHGIDVQHQFFHRHLQRWIGRCCADLRGATDARFYRAVGDFAQAFFAVEARALSFEA
ncbi:TorD/DmsD family molecular chaperone [Denitromonas iodatirespirans]|uniref:Molecular chaperone TorD family protein n=1 Tax=Denitromonas iodatirespirans TaxID=2795389 RepID=A0A944HB21_DENI1|nr:molecular chaperone TorD family protein [Denitromonas iodatirespirans]MBT0959906.1 molecular chaperone TorD family protein [Denitromonas iodatirespirans]